MKKYKKIIYGISEKKDGTMKIYKGIEKEVLQNRKK